jgi:hypothetical protein
MVLHKYLSVRFEIDDVPSLLNWKTMDLFLWIVLPPGGRVVGVEKSRKFASLALAACQVKMIFICMLACYRNCCIYAGSWFERSC